MEYRIIVREILEREVSVEAPDFAIACERIEDEIKDGELVLGKADSKLVTFIEIDREDK